MGDGGEKQKIKKPCLYLTSLKPSAQHTDSVHLLNTKQTAKGDTPSDQLLEMKTPHIPNLSLGNSKTEGYFLFKTKFYSFSVKTKI